MDRKNVFERQVDAPNHASKAENHQRTVDQGAERNLPELGGYAALKHISNRVKGWIVGISDEVCEIRIRASSNKCSTGKGDRGNMWAYTERRFA